MFDHDSIETGEAVQLGHMDVERHDIRSHEFHLIERLNAVAREVDPKIGLSRENAAEEFANQCRVVDHENLDHETTFALRSKASSNPRSARVRSSSGSSKSTIRF